jgi:hypothetical protein
LFTTLLSLGGFTTIYWILTKMNCNPTTNHK